MVSNNLNDFPLNALYWKYTYYTRDAQGNIMGIYEKTPAGGGMSYKIKERDIYGSSRLGSDNNEVELIGTTPQTTMFTHVLGNKRYELVNHLGNVLATVTDRKIPHSAGRLGQ